MILTPLQKFPNNVGDLGKTIFATGFEWLPKVQKIAQSGHIAFNQPFKNSRSLGYLQLQLMFSYFEALVNESLRNKINQSLCKLIGAKSHTLEYSRINGTIRY